MNEREAIDTNDTWACSACVNLNENEKNERTFKSLKRELVSDFWSSLILPQAGGQAGGRETKGSPPSLVTIHLITHHGLNTSYSPPPFFSAAKKSACYMNLTQQTTGHFFAASHASVCYHTLIYGFQVRIERERKTYGLEE